MGTEDSVNLFIREMNDMLDSHEISTNLGIYIKNEFNNRYWFWWKLILWITCLNCWILELKIESKFKIIKIEEFLLKLIDSY